MTGKQIERSRHGLSCFDAV